MGNPSKYLYYRKRGGFCPESKLVLLVGSFVFQDFYFGICLILFPLNTKGHTDNTKLVFSSSGQYKIVHFVLQVML